MQIHNTSGLVADGELPVGLNAAGGEPFTHIKIGFAEIYLHSPGDCDRLIRAAAEAKEKLLAAGDPQDIPAIVSAAIVQGHTLTYRKEADDWWWADLRRPDGTLADTGNGDDKAQALAHLAGRLARQEGQS